MRIRDLISDFIGLIVGVIFFLIMFDIVRKMINDVEEYYEEAVQFAEDFGDMIELGQPLYYFNFDPTSMVYVTPDNYEHVKAMWSVKDDE